MPSKKKKYNSRFPPARIKKIMQTDEDIGKVAAAVPVLISKCLEMFLASLLTKAGEVTKSKRAKTMSRTHLKECIMSETMFDFLKDQVVNIPDLQNEEEMMSGSTSFASEKEPPKKVVRKRSLPKAKKTPKKRPKLGHGDNNESEEESDMADDVSENGSGNEASDALHSSSFSSSGLLSPTIQKKLELPSDKDVQETPDTKSKPSIHIPLDILMSSDKISASVKIEKPLGVLKTEATKTLSDRADSKTQQSTTMSPDKPTTSSAVQNVTASPVRKGVIVENTAAYTQPTSSTSEMTSQNRTTASPSHSAQTATKESKSNNITDTKKENSVRQKQSEKSQQDNAFPITPQPGSMLSLLYGPAPVPLTSLPVPPATSIAPQQKYAYSPLTQHHYSEPNMGVRQPLPPTGPPPATNGGQGLSYQQTQPPASGAEGPSGLHSVPLPYPHPYAPYDPNITHRHYLGYPQTILTPPSHLRLPGVNSHMAAHPSLIHAKPAPRTRSDDDDYDT